MGGRGRGRGGGPPPGRGGGPSQGRGGGPPRGRGGGPPQGCGGGHSHPQGHSAGRGGGPLQGRGGGRSHPQGHNAGRGGGHNHDGHQSHDGGQTHGRGGSNRGSSRGGHGSHQEHKDIQELKRNLQETIKKAEKKMQEFELAKGDKQSKPAKKYQQDCRGSKSMMNLNSSPHHSQAPKGKGSWQHEQHRGGMGCQYGGFPTHHGFMHVPPAPPPPPPSHVYNNPYQNPFCHNNQRPPSFHQGPSAPPFDDHHDFPHQSAYNPGNVPPPSYDEAVQDIRAFNPTSSKSNLRAETLVKTLALFNGQFGSAETVGRQVEMHPEEVVNFAKSRKDLFSMTGEGKDTLIEYVPKVELCSDFFSSSGCTDMITCQKLHICKTYVTEFCKVSPCQYGHRWDTTHNNNILSKFCLDIIHPKVMHQIVKKVCKDGSKLRICNYYNSERGCKYENNCWQLHICKDYVMGNSICLNKGCSFNHDITAQSCIKILKGYGVPTNETPRDILMHVFSAVGKDMQASSSDNKFDVRNKQPYSKEFTGLDSSANESDDSCDSKVTDPHSLTEKMKRKKDRKPKNKCRTVKSTDVLGDVDIPEICLFGVDDKCKNFVKGCKYLHSKSLFHWQIEKEGKWYNLRIFQSKILETAYRDVSKRHVKVPALEQTKLEDFAKELLNVLGTSSWNADLKSMEMTCNDVKLKIRRVSSQSSALSDNPKATVFKWYFEDEQGKWIQYGQVDSLGKQELVCNLSSEDIERQYLSDPSTSMLICNARFKYKLDFSMMTQTNEDTNKVREIRRRPSGLSYQQKLPKSAAEDDPGSAVPDYWTQMTSSQTHILVPLDNSSKEYQEVAGSLRRTLPTVNIVKIERLQNPYLWHLFQYRKSFLSQRYDDLQLNMQKLFHGTDSQNIDTICKENFDWRKGIAIEQKYGQGTYFSHSAAIARDHCTRSSSGRCSMFLAHVIIGMVAEGDKSLTRPPVNPATDALFDTTVDDVNMPSVFVKYDKEEYYPEYIIEFY